MSIDYSKREFPNRCLYCDHDLPDEYDVPPATDVAGWETLAKDHATDCEWILSRAHKLRVDGRFEGNE